MYNLANMTYERDLGDSRSILSLTKSLEQAITISEDERICVYCSWTKNDIAILFSVCFLP